MGKGSFASAAAVLLAHCALILVAGGLAAATAEESPAPLEIPDVELVDQDGRLVHVYSDLVRGKRVAMNFVFTTCTTICPPMGANFERLQSLLGARAGTDVRLISVSVDPLTDVPARLKAWGAKFHAGPGWTLLTGRKEEVDRLLKALGVFTPDRADHAPITWLGDDMAGRWTRAHGFVPAAKMVQILDGLDEPVGGEAGASPPPAAAESPAREYFTDVELIDQEGRTQRLYSDLLAGKTVVIEAFFSECTGSCPVMAARLARLQAELGDSLERDLRLLSFTVDPRHDTPARLKEYAVRMGARPGWFFLTGKPENVEFALRKLGHYVEQREAHSNLLIVGNERTGLWKKVFGLSKPEEILSIVKGVLDDRGAPAPGR